ncbi:glycosyltransferase family 2 protein [Pseudomonas fluorescens]|uniref:glycosyltransferase family 2 protein n=1 Tax=Pseudomonas fluorescens TaxID=294 RepID=UPI0020C307BD|nr:glycosyltransferase family 2 protein [Pseudomonas fluorescens]UTL89486.1 glycosyltransferase family 2 protein [Pseudomonas fluorescens]
MKHGFTVRSKDGSSPLYVRDNKLTCGTNFSDKEHVHLYLNGDTGFFINSNNIINVVRVKKVGDFVSISNLESRTFLSSNPHNKDVPGSAGFNREHVGEWELFEILADAPPPSWVEFYFETLSSKSLSLVFSIIESGNDIEIPFLSYMLTSTSRAVLDYEISKRLSNSAFLDGILRIANGNYLITPLIRDLLGKTDAKVPKTIGVDRDIYGKVPATQNPWVILNCAIRKKIKKRGRSCIVATARNEGVYIIEWIAYHLRLGIDKIFLYTNNNQDGSLGLLRALHEHGFIELIESDVGPGGNAQVKAYTHSILASADVNRFEWCAFIDVDEYISYDSSKFSSFNDYLEWVGGTGADVVALSWILVANTTTSNDWTTTPVTQRLQRVSPFQSNLIKCLVRPESALTSGPHYPISNNSYDMPIVNSERKRYASERLDPPSDITRCLHPTFKNARLYHYELKSFPELIWKYSRNRGNYSALTADINLNDQFLSRVGHFRKCIDNKSTPLVELSVSPAALNDATELILSKNEIRSAYAEVVRSTNERYAKLLEYLPTFLAEKVSPDNIYDTRARDWINSDFLGV